MDAFEDVEIVIKTAIAVVSLRIPDIRGSTVTYLYWLKKLHPDVGVEHQRLRPILLELSTVAEDAVAGEIEDSSYNCILDGRKSSR
jgi:hypothetical protein